MTKKSSAHQGFAGFDASIALVITVVCILPQAQNWNGLRDDLHAQVRVMDALFAVTYCFFWANCFSVLEVYSTLRPARKKFGRILQGVTLMMVPLVLHLELFHANLFSLRTLVLTMTSLFWYEVAEVTLSAILMRWLVSRDPRRAVIIGSGRRASKAWRALRTRYSYSFKVLGFMDARDVSEMAPDIAARYLGTVDELSDVLLKEVVDVVLIAMPIQSCYALMQQAVTMAESVGVKVVYLDDIYSSRKQVVDATESIFMELAPQQEDYLLYHALKRLLDIVGATVGLILLSPLLLVISLMVSLESRGGMIFRQQRYGYRRRLCTMYKFRSMVQNAEQMLPSLESSNEVSGPIFKMRKDPRVTRAGKFLRSTSLDELPQLWNVLKGDMSLVGPRPMSIRDVKLFSEASVMRRFSVKPGMTGLWQVSGRSGTDFDHWVAMDHHYIDGWSLALDLKILLRTVGVVFRRSGAM